MHAWYVREANHSKLGKLLTASSRHGMHVWYLREANVSKLGKFLTASRCGKVALGRGGYEERRRNEEKRKGNLDIAACSGTSWHWCLS